MAMEAAQFQPEKTLSSRELRALTNAATWYAKYHESMIAELADDPSALAVSRRQQFEELRSALAKLGIRLRPLAKTSS